MCVITAVDCGWEKTKNMWSLQKKVQSCKLCLKGRLNEYIDFGVIKSVNDS